MTDQCDELEAAVHRYRAAPAHGRNHAPVTLDPTGRAEVDAAIVQIQTAIAPRKIPPEVGWFWRNWDAFSMGHPTSVPSLGQSESGLYEYDVVAQPLTGSEPRLADFGSDHFEVQRRALSGDVAGAAEAALPLGNYLTGDHAVVATAVRPV